MLGKTWQGKKNSRDVIIFPPRQTLLKGLQMRNITTLLLIVKRNKRRLLTLKNRKIKRDIRHVGNLTVTDSGINIHRCASSRHNATVQRLSNWDRFIASDI